MRSNFQYCLKNIVSSNYWGGCILQLLGWLHIMYGGQGHHSLPLVPPSHLVVDAISPSTHQVPSCYASLDKHQKFDKSQVVAGLLNEYRSCTRVSNPGRQGPLSCMFLTCLCSNTSDLSEWVNKSSAGHEEVIQPFNLVSWTRATSKTCRIMVPILAIPIDPQPFSRATTT